MEYSRRSEEQAKRVDDLNTEIALRTHDLSRQEIAAFDKAAIEAANLTIRSLIVVNGAAVIALLAFIGAIETGSSSQSVNADKLVAPMFSFALGVGFATITSALAYLVNLADGILHSRIELVWEHPYVIPKAGHRWRRIVRYILHYLAIGCAVAALVSFFFGVFRISDAIGSLGI